MYSTLYTYDSRPEDISAENVLRQSIELIAKLPLIAVYSYHSYRHFRRDERLYLSGIHRRDFPLAENILLMLRPDSTYTELEAKVLDIAPDAPCRARRRKQLYIYHPCCYLIRTDTYSSVAASIVP